MVQSNNNKKNHIKLMYSKLIYLDFTNKRCFHLYRTVGYNKQNNFLYFIRGKDSRAEYTGALIKIKK